MTGYQPDVTASVDLLHQHMLPLTLQETFPNGTAVAKQMLSLFSLLDLVIDTTLPRTVGHVPSLQNSLQHFQQLSTVSWRIHRQILGRFKIYGLQVTMCFCTTQHGHDPSPVASWDLITRNQHWGKFRLNIMYKKLIWRMSTFWMVTGCIIGSPLLEDFESGSFSGK